MLFMNLHLEYGMPSKISISTAWLLFDKLMTNENYVHMNWNWSNFSNPNWTIHTAIQSWNVFASRYNNTVFHRPPWDWLAIPWSRSTTTPSCQLISAISPFFGQDLPISTIYCTDSVAIPETNSRWLDCYALTWPLWPFCTWCTDTVDSLMNHTALKPHLWWAKPLNSEADTNLQPTFRCNFTHWVLNTKNNIDNGFENSFRNIPHCFLGFMYLLQPSSTSRTRPGNHRFLRDWEPDVPPTCQCGGKGFFENRHQAGRGYLNIKLSDIPKMVIFLLKHSYLTVGNHVFRQIQGASMGSQFAPALCGLDENFQSTLAQSHYDALPRLANAPTMGHLHQTWLLQSSILLEEVDDSEILGCHISTEQRSITIRQPLDLATLRSAWIQPRLRHCHTFSFQSQILFDHSLHFSCYSDHSSTWRSTGHCCMQTHQKTYIEAHTSNYFEDLETSTTSELAAIPQVSTKTSTTVQWFRFKFPRLLDL